ncbi:helix-turn-helix transcriptional regulator [Kocuria atrinae]|uniref:ArsR/SmtB family transcription factor n=1 Tax=Kocuria atrinae TaxID=592377 RepID=UPI0002D5CF0B|nr:metalloregulator ArsR/SmtB family transcription factor [Kocuria atrinae]
MTATSESLDIASSACCAPDPRTSECCSLSQGVLSAQEAQRVAGVLKALADPMRLRLLSHLAAQGCDSVCSCDFTEELGISQPTVSHHMKKLVDAGLITREQRGKWAHYSVVPEAFAEIRVLLDLR